ncbi:MAG: carbon storage regulator [Candidatus Paceibacterota bacterium]
MSTLRRRRGENVIVGEDISVTVLEMDRCEVKLGICASAGDGDGQLAGIRSNGSRYFLFPHGGPRTLVIRCETGKTVSLNGTSRLTLLNIAAGDATFRLDPPATSHLS